MKFGFSKEFRLHHYANILRELAAEIETYREISGLNITDMMVEMHISYPTLKKY